VKCRSREIVDGIKMCLRMGGEPEEGFPWEYSADVVFLWLPSAVEGYALNSLSGGLLKVAHDEMWLVPVTTCRSRWPHVQHVQHAHRQFRLLGLETTYLACCYLVSYSKEPKGALRRSNLWMLFVPS
jgi:hypothetical protein